MRKFLLTILWILAVLVLVGMGAFALFLIEWFRCAETKSVPELTETVFTEKQYEIGERIPCTFQVKTSWSLMPVSASYDEVKGIQEAKPFEIVPGKWNWGTRFWNVTLWLQPYHNGNFKQIPVRILFEGGPDGKAELKTAVPSFEVIPAEGNEIITAGQVPPAEEPQAWIWGTIAAALILIIILWLIFFRKKLEEIPEEPVWQSALNGITELRNALKEKKSTPENAIVKLTDIVRFYLEKQFSLRAEHQTTPEFLESLRNDDSLLDVEQRRFLQEFLSSADMIKFARLPANETQFQEIADHAEALIVNTSQENVPKENRS